MIVQISINYGGHDTSAALSINDKIVAAAEQERYDLSKHSRNFPTEAINSCLEISKLKLSQVDRLILTTDFPTGIRKFYLEPALKNNFMLKRLINEHDIIKNYLDFENKVRKKLNYKGEIITFHHHLCHIASAYYPSGFNKALILSLDGIGQFETGMLASANNGKIKIHKFNANYPHSLGLIYSAITFFLGWKHHCDEGIIMGLAPYGNPYRIVPKQSLRYIDVFRKIISIDKELGIKINTEWIAYHRQRNVWVSDKFKLLFGKKRDSNDKITNHHKNIAAALQLRLEEVVIATLKKIKKKYNINKLCIAGGVGLNCSLNGKIHNSNIFKEIFVQPASGDSGLVIGGLYLGIKNKFAKKLKIEKKYNNYLGSTFTNKEIEKTLIKKKVKFKKIKNICKTTASLLKDGKIVGWFQGGSEFGPRALGNRSIICRPYPAKMKDYLNKKVKFREYFRPFAPAILKEKYKEYFHLNQESPHMLIACKANKKKSNLIPAVVHVDGTCRVQTVSKETNLKFYNLIKEFNKLTSVPVVLNTSFNIKGQPMVNTPSQAIDTFTGTKIDILTIGDYIVFK